MILIFIIYQRKKEFSIYEYTLNFYLRLNLLDFTGVGFRIDEVELPEKMKNIYNKSVELWVELLHKFEEAAELISAEKKMRKTMWGQYWSSHQRFFKYLCIASKVNHVVKTASEVKRFIFPALFCFNKG